MKILSRGLIQTDEQRREGLHWSLRGKIDSPVHYSKKNSLVWNSTVLVMLSTENIFREGNALGKREWTLRLWLSEMLTTSLAMSSEDPVTTERRKCERRRCYFVTLLFRWRPIQRQSSLIKLRSKCRKEHDAHSVFLFFKYFTFFETVSIDTLLCHFVWFRRLLYKI